MIVTFDTNVLVSGAVFRGVPGRILAASVDHRFTLVLSPPILQEFRDVLSRNKFGFNPDVVEAVTRDLESHSVIAYPKKLHHVVMDDLDDTAVIDCAVEANAEYIVSGDEHLTALGTIERISVVTPIQFVQIAKLE